MLLLAVGSMVSRALDTAEILEQKGISTGVMNCSTVKPLDSEFLKSIPEAVRVYTLEEHMMTGGFGEYVSRYCLDRGYTVPDRCYAVNDCYIPHGDHERLMKEAGLNMAITSFIVIRSFRCSCDFVEELPDDTFD